MKRDITNVAASVRDRLLNQARTSGTDVQLLTIRYALERLLYRLSVSAHKDRFVLKGAMLFPAWTDDVFRPTRDLDLLGHGDNTPEALAETFREIFHQDVEEDGLVFDAEAVSARVTREEKVYSGVRIKSVVRLGTARCPVQVDIGFGDKITPEPNELDYPTILEFPAPRVCAYPHTTVVAEKFEAMVQLGLGSTQIRDFYDLTAISRLFEFDGSILAEAIRNTFTQRGTDIPADKPSALTSEFADKPESIRLWRQFIEDDTMLVKDTNFGPILDEIAAFVLPPTTAATQDQRFDRHWPAGAAGRGGKKRIVDT